MGGSTRSKRTWRRVLLLVVVAVVVLICVQIIQHRREVSGRLVCQARLKHLGTSLKLYMANHPDWRPQSSDAAIQALLDAGAVTPDRCVCPVGGEPYIFLLPASDAAEHDSRIVVAYEPLSNHAGQGGNVVYMDGHGEFERAKGYEALLAESRRKLKTQP